MEISSQYATIYYAQVYGVKLQAPQEVVTKKVIKTSKVDVVA